ncbi:MAG: NnrU family protein [Pseudomonadota bacterium]
MSRYLFCIGICTIIWILNGKCIIDAIKGRITSEVYIHTGLGIFFSQLTLELTLGILRLWSQFDILWLNTIGFLLFIPSVILAFGALIELKRKGSPKSSDFTDTTVFINSGLYSVIRQPITLGMAIWSTALLLVFQSTVSLILSAVSVFCFWMSANKETEYNVRKFGEKYETYMQNVPMWNIIEGLRRVRGSKITQ